MRYNFKSRLEAYHNLIGHYDFIEKHNLFGLEPIHLKSLNVSWTTNKSTKNSLNSLLLKEFLTSQHLNFQSLESKKKNNLSYFTITLRSSYLFFYLEILLNTFYLFSNIKYFNNSFIFMEVPYHNTFFNSKFNIQKMFFTITISLNFFKSEYKAPILNYYFLPKIRRIA